VKELGRKLHRISPILIMPALDAGIFLASPKEDGRVKPGHDEIVR
jgi:hypothetical protein